jgi:hypothetical protein
MRLPCLSRASIAKARAAGGTLLGGRKSHMEMPAESDLPQNHPHRSAAKEKP